MKALMFISMCLCFILVKQQGLCQMCGTPDTAASPSWVSDAARISSLECFRANIFVHIVRSSSGQGLGDTISSTLVNRLNTGFQSAGIQFSLMGSDYIDDDTYYIDISSIEEENNLFTKKVNNNAINIYVLGTSTTWGPEGKAKGIRSTSFIIKGTHYDDAVLSHEMGHCLGLYHTFQNTYQIRMGLGGVCAELVNGTNGDTCGDYIRDTPADPGGDIWNGCTYTGTVVDDNREAYRPSASNFMSYAGESCWTSFTLLQKDRMLKSISNVQELKNTGVELSISAISGNGYVCSSETYSLDNMPTGSTITWTSSDSSILTITEAGVATRVGTQSGNVTLTASSSGCGNSSVSKRVFAGAPRVRLSSATSTCKDGGVTVTVCMQDASGTSNWSWRGLDASFSGSSTCSYGYMTSNNSMGAASVEYTDVCAERSASSIAVVNPCSQSGMGMPSSALTQDKGSMAYPNPASDKLSVQLTGNEPSPGKPAEIILFDKSQQIIFKQTTNDSTVEIPVNNLSPDTYFLNIFYNGQLKREQIVVK